MVDYSNLDQEEAVAVSRVVEVLDRRIDLDHRQTFDKRHNRRNRYHGQVMLHLPENEEECLEGDSEGHHEPALFMAWGRNISRGGMALLSRRVFRCKEVMVGMIGGDDAPIWIRAEILRRWPAPLGFREYGLAFREKVSERYFSRLPREQNVPAPIEIVHAAHEPESRERKKLHKSEGTRIDHSPSTRKSVTRMPSWSVPIVNSNSRPD